jgi:hypothetical protein
MVDRGERLNAIANMRSDIKHGHDDESVEQKAWAHHQSKRPTVYDSVQRFTFW